MQNRFRSETKGYEIDPQEYAIDPEVTKVVHKSFKKDRATPKGPSGRAKRSHGWTWDASKVPGATMEDGPGIEN